MARRQTRHPNRDNIVYHYYKCSMTRIDSIYKVRCGQNTYFPAAPIDADLWAQVKTVVSDPDLLSKAFQEYRSTLKSEANPIRDRLERKQKRLVKTERKLEMLLREYLDGELPQDRYRKT